MEEQDRNLAQNLLTHGAFLWPQLLGEANMTTLHYAHQELAEIATQAVYLCRYVEGMILGQSHKRRVIGAKAAARKARKAVKFQGYHYLLNDSNDPLAELGE